MSAEALPFHVFLFQFCMYCPMTFLLVQATEADSEFVYQLKKVVLKEYVQQTWQRWDEDFQRRFHREHFDTTHIKVIVADGIPAGTVDVREGDGNIFVSGLYILLEYQNKGIGSSILRQLVDKAQIEGKRLELEVLRVNTAAQRLYKRLGFVMEEKDDQKFFMYK